MDLHGAHVDLLRQASEKNEETNRGSHSQTCYGSCKTLSRLLRQKVVDRFLLLQTVKALYYLKERHGVIHR